MNLLSRAKYLNKEVLDAKAKLKEVFQNESLRKDTRWDYFLAFSLINTEISIGLPEGYIGIATEEGLAPWENTFQPEGWIVSTIDLVRLWESKGLNVVKLKDFFMETAITTMVMTDE